MQFFRYWTRGKVTVDGSQGPMDVTAFGYSNESVEDALAIARKRAQANGARLLSGREPSGDYYGSNHPLREQVVEELEEDGETVAIISRNSYGCLVLNTHSVFFADIDQPKPKRSSAANPLAKMAFGFLKKLIPPQQNPENPILDKIADQFDLDDDSPAGDFESQLVNKINALVAADYEMAIRLYRTSKGFRAIILNELIPCMRARSTKLLDAFGSDKLYVSLCRSQDCYRARLTPKPWRCNFHQPKQRFPFDNPDQQNAFDQWLSEYDSLAANYATCALIGNFGSGQTDPLVARIVQVHDLYALNDPKPLA